MESQRSYYSAFENSLASVFLVYSSFYMFSHMPKSFIEMVVVAFH